MEEKVVVNMDNSEIKKETLVKLKGKWGIANRASLIYLLLFAMIVSVSSYVLLRRNINYIAHYLITGVISLFVLGFGNIGIRNISLVIAKNETPDLSQMWIGFKPQNNPIKFQAVFEGITFAFYIVIGVLAVLIMGRMPVPSDIYNGATPLFYLFAIPVVVIQYIISLSISMMWYIKLENPQMEIKEIIKKSMHLMRGNKPQLFGLYLSIFGWTILASIGAVVTLLVFRFSSALVYLWYAAVIIGALIGGVKLQSYAIVWVAQFYLCLTGRDVEYRATNIVSDAGNVKIETVSEENEGKTLQ